MSKNKLVQMEVIFRTFITPLIYETRMDDFDFVWEFEKYLLSKKDEIASAEKQDVRKWQAPLTRK